MDMNAYYHPQIPQPSPTQADPRGSTQMSDPFAYYADSESMPTQFTPYGTWSQINPSDYSHSQPHSEAFQQVYNIDENPFRQPYNHIGHAATFISTSRPQTGSLRDPGSLYPPQVMEPKSYNSHITNSTNSFEEDRVSSGGPSSTKKRRRQFSPEDREKIKGVRRLGACMRCRIMRLRVSFSLTLFHVSFSYQILVR